jgi:hypothetical protein
MIFVVREQIQTTAIVENVNLTFSIQQIRPVIITKVNQPKAKQQSGP